MYFDILSVRCSSLRYCNFHFVFKTIVLKIFKISEEVSLLKNQIKIKQKKNIKLNFN